MPALILSDELCQMGISFSETRVIYRKLEGRAAKLFFTSFLPSSGESSTDMFRDLLERVFSSKSSDLNFNAFVAPSWAILLPVVVYSFPRIFSLYEEISNDSIDSLKCNVSQSSYYLIPYLFPRNQSPLLIQNV